MIISVLILLEEIILINISFLYIEGIIAAWSQKKEEKKKILWMYLILIVKEIVLFFINPIISYLIKKKK
jgi:hypothetical protein